MSSKRPFSANEHEKRARKVMTVEEKIKVLDRLASGESAASVSRSFGVNESSIRTIHKNEAKIRAGFARETSNSSEVVRDHNLERMETALYEWIEDQAQSNVSLTSGVIQREKRSRKVMTVEEKVKVLDRLASGESAASVSRGFGVNESTIRTIKKNEVKIRASFACGTSNSSKVRDHNLERMETALFEWIEDQAQRNVSLTSGVICEKARCLYNYFIEKDYDKTSLKHVEFKASHGWFENFKKRYSQHKIKFCGERTSVDHIDTTCEKTKCFQSERLTNIQLNGIEKLLEPQVVLLEENSDDINHHLSCSSDEEEVVNKGTQSFTADSISDGIQLAFNVADFFVEIDPNPDRSLNFKRGLEELLKPYKKAHIELVKSA